MANLELLFFRLAIVCLSRYDIDMSDQPVKPDENRNSKGQFVPGSSGNPNGRPKGKTLKEFARDWYMSKTDEEKRAYLADIEEKKPGFAWQMAEGMPSTKQEIKADVHVNSLSELSDEELDAILAAGNSSGESEEGEGQA